MCIPIVNACLILYLQLQLGYKDIWIFPAAAIFKNRLLEMAATVMTVEFGTIHYLSLEENSEACMSSSLNKYFKITENHVNYDILI